MDDMFDNLWVFHPLGMDPELEATLKRCKTEEEKNEVMQEYVIQNVKSSLIALAIVIGVIILIAVISYFSK